jgi:hypothetical protein
MSKERPTPPESVDSLARRQSEELIVARFPERAHAKFEIEMSPAIPAANLPLDGIQQGAGLDSASHTGWRFIIIVSGEPVALADVGVAADGTAEFRSLNYGPFVQSIAKAVEYGQRSVAKHGGTLELLSVPALYVVALWHDTADGEGTITPLDPAPRPFDAGREYPEEDFAQILTELARDVGPDGSALPSTTEDRDGRDTNDHDEDDRGRS